MNKPGISINVARPVSIGWPLIQITLILLKAFGFIDWSWLTVLFFPLIFGIAVLAAIAGVVLCVFLFLFLMGVVLALFD